MIRYAEKINMTLGLDTKYYLVLQPADSSFLCLLPQWIGLFFLTKTIVNGSARYFLQLIKVRMPNTVVRFTIVN